jgi:N-acetylglucosamine kinase-like BadF-type ATPase
MTQYFLGVDIGNTKSQALIITQGGEVAGFGTGAPGNHEVLGVEGFQSALHAVFDDALKNAGLERAQIAGAGYGIAGYDWDSDMPLMRQVIDTLGMNAPYTVVNDGMMGLIAGAKRGWGVCISAGTSCNARGRNPQGDEGRVTGNGWVCGEYGGGIELTYKALDAISRAWSLRAPATLLSDLFVRHLGAVSVVELLEGVARGKYPMQATYAPLVFEAAEQGDAVARELLEWISLELASLGIGVIRQIKAENEPVEVVLAGSFYKGSPLIAEWIGDAIHAIAPRAELVRLEAPPVVGSALLGVEAAGQDFTAIRERVVQATHAVTQDTAE